MYRFGRRLESLNTVSDPSEIMTLLTEQGQSLLVALNALTFVEEASAWFTHCEEGDALSIELRRKKRKLDIQMTQALAEFGMTFTELVLI